MTKQNIASTEQNVNDFHKSRRMFAIIDNHLYLGPINTAASHFEWLVSENLVDINNKNLDGLTRGFVDDRGLFFYEGDFLLTYKAESDVFRYLDDLISDLDIDVDLHLFGGFIKGEIGEKWQPARDYGALRRM